MKELLYLEVPTPDIGAVRSWLQTEFIPSWGHRSPTPDGIRLTAGASGQVEDALSSALSIFTWTLQRTTYLKVFRWGSTTLPREGEILKQLQRQLQATFPPQYPELPAFDPSQQTIFEALRSAFPKTTTYFQRMPNGEADLERVYWWETRWRQSVRSPQAPRQVIFRAGERSQPQPWDETALAAQEPFDLIYVGGALGVIHAAVMAQLGYRVLLIERLPFGRMHREWNISRAEFQSLIDLGLFTAEEFETLIACEYADGFNKFFDANNPAVAKAPVLHTPTVLNIALDSEALLRSCGKKLQAAGGVIWDETEFDWAEVDDDQVTVVAHHRKTEAAAIARGRLLVDAMGTASPIAWQLNGGRAFDSVCPTVGACVSGGFDPGVWDSTYGDVLFSHGDISRGRQLIWELFPGKDNELTIYLFHYHQVHPDNPGSLLTMYEDFFHILPEYRRCNLDKLTWRKPTFGYIPGHFSSNRSDRTVAFDRLAAIGDAASLQSPLVFTGFGSLVRNLPRLTALLDMALRHDLLKAKHLNQIRAFQSNIAVTWLFSKGMMVPTGTTLPPERVNAMLNTFFGILGQQPPEVAERFIKDRASWGEFNAMALSAAAQNPSLLQWIWEMAGTADMVRWVGSYLNYTLQTFLSWLLAWLPLWVSGNRGWLERVSPELCFSLLALGSHLTYGMGRPPAQQGIHIQTLEVSTGENAPQAKRPARPAPLSTGGPASPDSGT
ncbi:MAG: flavin-dependent dehydrogenase [Cyanobacteria bacterium]|nr:flavin-dependent dehydrogenase [Cyanobacteriota bacterium]